MIETKEVRLEGSLSGDKYFQQLYQKSRKYVEDLKSFGWQPTQTVERHESRSYHHYQILARETTMKNYSELVRLESLFENAKSSIKSYQKAEFSTVLLLLLIFIFPGIIYLAYKSNQKQKIYEHNQNCQNTIKKSLEQAKALL